MKEKALDPASMRRAGRVYPASDRPAYPAGKSNATCVGFAAMPSLLRQRSCLDAPSSALANGGSTMSDTVREIPSARNSFSNQVRLARSNTGAPALLTPCDASLVPALVRL